MKKSSMEVFYNKSKIKTRLIPLSCLLVFLPFGAIKLLYDFFQRSPHEVKVYLPIVGVLSGFGLMIYYFIFQMFSFWLKKFTLKKPVFIIDEKGITDKISIQSVGFIPWSNIKKVSAFNSRNHYLVFFINDKQELINKFKSVAKKRKVAQTFKKNGSNVRIEVDWLDGNVYLMKKLAQAKLDEFNNTSAQVA